jgi:hypothetical protein
LPRSRTNQGCEDAQVMSWDENMAYELRLGFKQRLQPSIFAGQPYAFHPRCRRKIRQR